MLKEIAIETEAQTSAALKTLGQPVVVVGDYVEYVSRRTGVAVRGYVESIEVTNLGFRKHTDGVFLPTALVRVPAPNGEGMTGRRVRTDSLAVVPDWYAARPQHDLQAALWAEYVEELVGA